MSYYGKIAIAKLNEKDKKENKMDVESIVKGLRKKELEKAGFDKKSINYLTKNNTEDEKENASVEDKFSYKGCLITILKKSEGKYTFSITQKGREEGSNNVYSTQAEAERKAKREVEEEWANSKGEDMNYYEKIIAEKKNKKEEKTNEDAPFTKKRECLATLDRMLYYVQRKKSQVQQWKYIDEDFDENEFLSDLKDVLRAIEGIMG